MFGGISMIADTTIESGAQLIVRICEMISDPDRKALHAELKELAGKIKEGRALLAEIEQREQALARREKQAAAHEAAQIARGEVLVEQEAQARATMQEFEAKRVELQALKNELRGWAKAAA
jgi:hypothetical protein